MNDFSGPLPTAPKEGDRIFLKDGATLSWVQDLAGHAMNGCFRVVDRTGKTRVVKRFKDKDLPGQPAWIALN